MTLLGVPRINAPLVTAQAELMGAAGFVDRDAVGGVLVLEDNFIEGSDTLLDAHTPDTGGPYTRNADADWSTAAANLQVGGGDGWCELITNNTNSAYYVPASGSADLDITVILNQQLTTNASGQLWFRSILTELTGYRIIDLNKTLTFQRASTGSFVTIETLDTDLPNGELSPVRIKMVGSDYTIWYGDIEDTDTPVATGSDSNHAGPGYVHIRQGGATGQRVHVVYVKVLEL